MRRAMKLAEGTRRRFGNDPDKVAEAPGLIVLEEDLVGRLREIYFGDAIVVRRDLPELVKRELIAHAIGHHVMHAGNHLAVEDRVYSFGNHHEKQADVFAAFLLVPEEELQKKLKADRPLPDLASDFAVTDEMMLFRLQLRDAARFAERDERAAQEQKTLDKRRGGTYYKNGSTKPEI